MATVAAQVTDAGISAPGYADVLQELKIAFWGLYGSDANLAPDSQDGQWLAIIAQAIHDTNQTAIAVYNSFAPGTAQAAALSRMVRLNGISRLVATNSQAVVSLVGEVGRSIVNGLVGDSLNLGTQWALPALVTFPLAGTIDVTATCTTPGAVSGGSGTLTVILTPTLGWQSVTNLLDAALGNPIETDAQLRRRQANSTARAAKTLLETVYGTVAELGGVSRLQVYENDNDAADANGIPGHSIAVVVEGGDVVEIATAIARTKGPGCNTYGSTNTTVLDDNGVPDVIHFFPLASVSMDVEVTIQPLAGYVSTTGTALRQAVADFLNALEIGEDSYLLRLYTPANMSGVGLGSTFVVTAIRQARHGQPLGAANIAIAFNEATLADLANITLVTLP